MDVPRRCCSHLIPPTVAGIGIPAPADEKTMSHASYSRCTLLSGATVQVEYAIAQSEDVTNGDLEFLT
jgi:hypothetical protein